MHRRQLLTASAGLVGMSALMPMLANALAAAFQMMPRAFKSASAAASSPSNSL